MVGTVRRSLLAAAVLSGTLVVEAAGQQTRARIAAAVDSIVESALKDKRAAGASVAVVRGRDTLAFKGYGQADLEWQVPTDVRAVYEIGSVTKQFTAAALLQLQEQGKLSLEDELTKYLPNYPTQGHKVTLRRLLDHTSGIKGYTEMPVFGSLMMRKLPRDSLVALFSAEPFDFAPGAAQVYNNSAYFLLGLVIEQVSGQSYGDYVKQHLFDRAGMSSSRYCSESAVIERRANGYDFRPTGLQRAAYLDHTWPYAAGSLCSTVGDLVAWNRALHGGRILSGSSYRELIGPGTLNDGTRLRYAKGLSVDSAFGRPLIAHGGGINGFLSQLDYYPEDSLSIVVLINTGGPVSPGAIARDIAEVFYGKWSPRGVAFTRDAADYAGEYRGVGRGRELVARVTASTEGSGLSIQTGNAPARPLVHLGNELFALGNSRFTFVRENGKIVKLRADLGSVYSILQRK
ncbi:MAG TPA: serine hydrolase domain-containing protein [Longimicrobiales bacterium]|nr:serine hydrolase domain-containing protein [Longimicrobiales bacterium]